jgi:hypothetical protein
MVMAWSSRSQKEELQAELLGATTRAPFVSIRSLAEMLEEQTDAGHLARRKPEALARILMGSTRYFVFLGLVRENAPPSALDEDTCIEDLTRVVLGDVDPSRAPRRKGKARR